MTARETAWIAKGHFKASAPACAQIPSWSALSPETPMAPTILPFTINGTPPSMGLLLAGRGCEGLATSRDHVLKRFAGTFKKRGSSRFLDRHARATGLRVVHLLVVNQSTAGTDYSDGHVPVILARLGEGDGCDLFRVVHSNRRPVRLWSLSVSRHAAKDCEYDRSKHRRTSDESPRAGW
jgi:hypothetical protein